MSTPPSPAASVHGDRGTKIIYARTICRPADELYDYLRDFSRLLLLLKETPAGIRHLGNRFEIASTDDAWRIIGTIINERRGELIAWRSEPESDLTHAGSIRFDPAPGDEGTEVTVTFEYEATGGKLGGKLAKLTHTGPGKIVADTLRRFKALMEAGEIPTIEGQSVGEPQKSNNKK